MSAPVPTLYEWAGGSEAFGGPPLYTEEHGGYPHMLSGARRRRTRRRIAAGR